MGMCVWKRFILILGVVFGLQGCVSARNIEQAPLIAETYYLDEVVVRTHSTASIPVRYDTSVAEFIREGGEPLEQRAWASPVEALLEDEGHSAISPAYLRAFVAHTMQETLNQEMKGSKPARMIVNIYSMYFPDKSTMMFSSDMSGARIGVIVHERGQDEMIFSTEPFYTIPSTNFAAGWLGMAIRAAVKDQHVRDLEDVGEGIVNDTHRLLFGKRVPYHHRNVLTVYE